MGYCTRTQIEDRRLPATTLIDLLDDERIGEENDKIVERLSAILSDVDEEINVYLSGYALPFDEVPTVLIGIAVDMAAYGIHSRRDGEQPENVRLRYKRAIVRLEEIRDSKKRGEDLLFPPAPVANDDNAVFVNKSDSDRIFSDTRLNQML